MPTDPSPKTEPEPQPVTRENEILDRDKPAPETENIEEEGDPLGANFA